FVWYFDQIPDTMLHQLADQPKTMGATDGSDLAAEKRIRLLMIVRQGLDVQSALPQITGIVRRPDHRDSFLSQPLFRCSIEMVEVAFLAVGNQAMGHRFERLRCRFRQLDHGVALPRAE